jgi:hypothetical protein
MSNRFRIFLSAVSSEFGRARDALAAELRSRELLLRVQCDFRLEAERDTTLRKLHAYIRDRSAVVCVIGQRGGAVPPPAGLDRRHRTDSRFHNADLLAGADACRSWPIG